jgi:hypothetical protein
MATEAPVRASAAPATRRPAAVVSASRLLLGQRPFLAPSASRSRFAAGRAAVAAGVGPRLLKPRISVVAMAGNGERVPAVWRSYFFLSFLGRVVLLLQLRSGRANVLVLFVEMTKILSLSSCDEL